MILRALFFFFLMTAAGWMYVVASAEVGGLP